MLSSEHGKTNATITRACFLFLRYQAAEEANGNKKHGNDTAHGEIFQTATRLAAMALSGEWPTIGDLIVSRISPGSDR